MKPLLINALLLLLLGSITLFSKSPRICSGEILLTIAGIAIVRHNTAGNVIEKQVSCDNFSTQTWAKTQNLGSVRKNIPNSTLGQMN